MITLDTKHNLYELNLLTYFYLWTSDFEIVVYNTVRVQKLSYTAKNSQFHILTDGQVNERKINTRRLIVNFFYIYILTEYFVIS